MEATSTRRAGLERFRFPHGWKPYKFVIGLANDFVGLALRTVIGILTDNDNRLTSASFSYRISTN